MNAEGIGVVITSEWLQATLTGIPVLFVAWMLMYGLSSLWQRTILLNCGEDLKKIAKHLKSDLTSSRFGIVIESDRFRVVYSGGFWGERTHIEQKTSKGKSVIRLNDFGSADQVIQELTLLESGGFN